MSEELKPCPFCGGAAEIIEIEGGENEGGSCVSCTRCEASSNVEFGFKENFVSNWNRRATASTSSATGKEQVATVVEGEGSREELSSSLAHAETIDSAGGGVDEDKGNHDCLAKRRPGEPMFILLGRDPDAHNIVRSWAERRLAAGGDPAHCQMGLDTAARMQAYATIPANKPASAPPPEAYPPAPTMKDEDIPAEAMARVEALEAALLAMADLYDTDEGTRSLPQYIAARALLSGSTPKPERVGVEISEEMVDHVWAALKAKCCAHKPDHPDFDKVSRVVMVSREDLSAALSNAKASGEDRA